MVEKSDETFAANNVSSTTKIRIFEDMLVQNLYAAVLLFLVFVVSIIYTINLSKNKIRHSYKSNTEESEVTKDCEVILVINEIANELSYEIIQELLKLPKPRPTPNARWSTSPSRKIRGEL